MVKIRSCDTETTGLDWKYGCQPFFVSFCDQHQKQIHFEWQVDPLTRKVMVPVKDKFRIRKILKETDILVFQNIVFDAGMLSTIDIEVPFEKSVELQRLSHAVDSLAPRNLTVQSRIHLGVDISGFEAVMREAVKKARRIAKTHLPDWRQAKDDDSMLPSGGGLDADYWLLRQIAIDHPELLPEEDRIQKHKPHPWSHLLRDYGNMDTAVTVAIYLKLIKRLEEEGTLKHCEELNKIYPIIYKMTNRGVSVSRTRLDGLITRFEDESTKYSVKCRRIAEKYDYDLELPKSGNNKSLSTFVSDVMKLPLVKRTDSGAASLDKDVIAHYIDTLEHDSEEHDFIESLMNKRKRDTGLNYALSYKKYGRRFSRDWITLHSSYNPTATNTLRWGSHNPSGQTISKKEGTGVREPFGPRPGRLWASLDMDNLELRIPAYECKEPAMLELFEHPDKPPYFGSYHLLIFSILHPDKYDHNDEQGLIKARDKYKSTWYQWTKNGNFAELYGAVDTHDGKSTADRAFHVPGAQAIVASRLKEKTFLNQQWINYANRYGYVETMPDIEIDPKHGYRLRCPKNSWGKILQTVPLNYHVQGTAVWVLMRAMIKIAKLFEEWDDWHFVFNIHDEIVLDFPRNCNYIPKLKTVRRIMGEMGDLIGVKLTAGCKVHDVSWAKGYELDYLIKEGIRL